MIHLKGFDVAFFVVFGLLFSSPHGASPNKEDGGESFEDEDIGFRIGLGGKWPWDWGPNIGVHLGNGQGPNDDDIGLRFDLGNGGPVGSHGKPSTGSGASRGGIETETATGVGIGNGGDDGCGGCLSVPNCGYYGNPRTAAVGSGSRIGPGTGTGPDIFDDDDGCGGCLSDWPGCGYVCGSLNQPMCCRPLNCPDGGDCGGFGLHLDFGWPSLLP